MNKSTLIQTILEKREEILEAFIAKYRCDPDEVVLIEERLPDGNISFKVERKPPKVCKLSCGMHSWILEVTGESKKYFTGWDIADVFADLYSRLGYKVEWDKNLHKRETEEYFNNKRS